MNNGRPGAAALARGPGLLERAPDVLRRLEFRRFWLGETSATRSR